jgi:citrate lyase subunit beta/citryl-CoA lyase
VIATETPRALLKLGEYAAGTPGLERLVALTWGMEDLSAALGASAKTENDGSLTPVFELARSLCLVAAAAAAVQAIDGVHADFRDSAGLTREAARARRDGFTAKLAIHPDQVPIINAAFSPSAAEVERARRVVAAFAAAPGAGVTSLDGQMLDRPHLVLAQRILELSSQIENCQTGMDKP